MTQDIELERTAGPETCRPSRLETTSALELDTPEPVVGLAQFYGCDEPAVALYAFADGDQASAAADEMVNHALGQEPPTVEETLARWERLDINGDSLYPEDLGIDSDRTAAERYVEEWRPNRETQVPGVPDARGLLLGCDTADCGTANAIVVRGNLVVTAHSGLILQATQDQNLANVATLLQAQLERL